MAEIGRWNGHVFEVSPKLIRGFTGLTIKGASETEEKESNGQSYVSRKHGKPMEVSLTVSLNALMGCDVRTEATRFVAEARDGCKDYFYVGNKKLATCQLMLTEASVKEVEIAGGGKWVRADVSLTMKQCSKNDGSFASSSGGGSSGGGSTNTPKKQSVKQESLVSKIKNGVKNVVNKVKTGVKNVVNALTGKKTSSSPITSAIKSAQSAIKKITTAAKKTTTTKKTTKGGGGGSSKITRTMLKQ